jgi:photosystem II stability/assembly factor-like uncharacterized protein
MAWTNTGASGMNDVAILGGDPVSEVWLTGENGSVWMRTMTGEFVRDTTADGFRRIAVGPDARIWAVGKNGTLWARPRLEANWTQTNAGDVVDVTVSAKGTLWLTDTTGNIWSSTDDGDTFERDQEAEGFARVATDGDQLWAVGTAGSVWFKRDGKWNQTSAEGFADIAAVEGQRTIWLTGHNETVWFSTDNGNSFRQDPDAAGFESIDAGFWGPWAVGRNGSLWHNESPHVK